MSDDEHRARRGERQRPPARERSARHRSEQRPSERARRTDPARLTAYTAMREIADGAYANLALPRLLRDKRLTGRDAGFATELVYGATRMSGLYDAIIASAAGRPVGKIDANVLDTLRLGAHQVLGMRVATHAAVDETVALARQVNGAGAAGFVNAVMRRISERDPDEWVDLVTQGITDPVERLAMRTSHPVWVAKALRAALIGHGAATPDDVEASLTALLEVDNEPAKVSLVARPGLSSLDELEGWGATRTGLSPVGAVLDEGDPGAIDAVRDGRAAVQDEGSQLLVLALASANVEGPAAADERWLDLCAGPGGKAGLLAALAIERRIPFVANEISEHRADLVWQTLAAARAAARDADTSLKVRHGDGRDMGEVDPAAYSRVLIDAPCTGLGALRRRPEARWRRSPGDVAALAWLQRELLSAGIDATAPGGLVGYATCSPHLNETRFVVADLLKRRDDIEVVDARGLFVDASGEQLPALREGPYVQLWPHVHGTDAMFFALLRKTG
ncbi:RsmB/NOP family class I SAM-dependent RNA methyltransferase [Humibacillus xanthopallidus]|uniref:16S rRNA (Cytosine967-C5)-methyltransferase n=1 Tax=Humibacillus xanthopallidus TaxID=412689 RepID=A0A543HJ43_9MICO|nr:transcription antitermination factor NusB [Humibacillus xanthopallidus]TQM58310.1 16S rRNA (cytosine967-C5)-methyltransferase [Humibacillus xanthopallidus]